MKPSAVCVVIIGILIATLPMRAQTMREQVQPYVVQSLAEGNAFVAVSAASGRPEVAPGSLATLFGASLATQTVAGQAPYPTSLGGISLQIVDSAGTPEAAQLLYVSPDQINFVVPPAAAIGVAAIHIVNGTGMAPSGSMQVQNAAPGLFTANGNGMGVVAATAYRTLIPTSITSPVMVFQCGAQPGSCVSVPIDPGIDTPVTVTLYATGLRNRSSDSAVMLTIGSTSIPIRSISSPDDSSALAGIDLMTFPVLLNLRGSGEVDVVLTVDGVESNHGRINIQ